MFDEVTIQRAVTDVLDGHAPGPLTILNEQLQQTDLLHGGGEA